MWFAGETDRRSCGGEGALVEERWEREECVGSSKENTSPKPLVGEMREADFHDFVQPVGLKDWSHRGLGKAGIEPRGRCPTPGEKADRESEADGRIRG